MQRIMLFLLVSFACTAWVNAQYLNVMVGNQNDPNEPSIAINPKDPMQMAAGANIDNCYFSGDGGMTWTPSLISSTMGVWGDPVIIADTAGSFYFFHLSNPSASQFLDRIVCQKSVNGGATWSNGSYMGLNGSKDQDKEWGIVDPVTNNIYVTWTQFDAYGSSSALDSSHIMFSRSVDGGLTWMPAMRINEKGGDCLDMDNTVEGAVPAAGPSGEVYVAWAGPLGLVFTKSTDKGLTWPSSNKVVAGMPGGWDYSIPGIFRANGLPVTCCDLSNSPYRGTIYINWTDQRNGAGDTDVWLIKSTDGGDNWTLPKRINNDPPGKHQFFSWMTIDPVTGYVYIVFYDRRNYNDNLTDVWLAVSRDGGETFINFPVSETPFNPVNTIFFGDYTNIAAYDNIIRPIWTRLHGGALSVMTALVDDMFAGVFPGKEPADPLSLEQNYPNPAQSLTYISFKVHIPATVRLAVYDIYGHEVAVLVNGRKVLPGKYIEPFDRMRYGLAPGFYFYTLTGTDSDQRRKMILY